MSAALKYMLTGGASNSDPNLSLGGAGSSTELPTAAMNNLFDSSTPAESAAGFTDYRAIDVVNSGDAEAQTVSIFISAETPSPDSEIWLSSEGVDPTSPLSLTDEADSTNVLAGQIFTHSLTNSKLSLPNIPANSKCRIWIKRIVSAAAVNINNDLMELSVWFA